VRVIDVEVRRVDWSELQQLIVRSAHRSGPSVPSN
jgi:hypothetical protein